MYRGWTVLVLDMYPLTEIVLSVYKKCIILVLYTETMVPPDISVKLNEFQSTRISKFQSQILMLIYYIFLGQSSIPMAAKSLIACKRESDKCSPSGDFPKYSVGWF